MNITYTRYCHVCGAKIERMYWDEYIYKKCIGKKNKIIYFCSWNCMRQFEKQSKVKRHGRIKSRRSEETD